MNISFLGSNAWLWHECRVQGLRLIVDNSLASDANLGPHARVSWSVDTTTISSEAAAVVLALSSSDITRIHMIGFTLYNTKVAERTGLPTFLCF
jgi:hypothetical protein